MKEPKNPLRIFFNVSLFVLLCDAINIAMRSNRVEDFSDMVSFSWNSIHKFVVTIGLLIFIYFYYHKSMKAWFALMGVCVFSFPMLFLMDFQESSIMSSTQFLSLLLVLGIIAIAIISMTYKPYKRFIDGK